MSLESQKHFQAKFVWQCDKGTAFIEQLACDDTDNKLNTVERNILNCSNIHTQFINVIVLEIINVISDVASDMFLRKVTYRVT